MSHPDAIAGIAIVLLGAITGGLVDIGQKLHRLQSWTIRPKNPDGTDQVLESLQRIEHTLELIDMRLNEQGRDQH